MTIYYTTIQREVAELIKNGRIIGMIKSDDDNDEYVFISIEDVVLGEDGAIEGTMKQNCYEGGEYLSYYDTTNIAVRPLQLVHPVDYLYFIDEDGHFVNVRQFVMEKHGDYDVYLEIGGEKEEEEEEEKEKEKEVVPLTPPKIVRGFNNRDHDHIHMVLRMWLQDNDHEYIKRDDDVTDDLYKTKGKLDWWDLGVVKGGPCDYDVDTLDGFISTLSLNKQVFYPELDPFYYNDPDRFEFSRRQAAMIYDAMMKK
jgi:hypothetical protein